MVWQLIRRGCDPSSVERAGRVGGGGQVLVRRSPGLHRRGGSPHQGLEGHPQQGLNRAFNLLSIDLRRVYFPLGHKVAKMQVDIKSSQKKISVLVILIS